MRPLSHVGALLAVAALSSAAISAQTPAANSPRVQHVIVRGSDVRGSDVRGNDLPGSDAAIEVEIHSSGSVAPNTQAVSGPDRIIVDFPGALPAAELRALQVNRGALKGIRPGLFFSNPPITRIVLDLSAPQSYQISTTQNTTVVKLGPVKLGAVAATGTAPAAKLQNVSLVADTRAADPSVAASTVSTAVSNTMAAPLPAVSEAPPPPKPAVTVTFINGMLRIRADKATLAQVLFEVQRQTLAEIAIPAGAEQEEMAADLGPAPARDVLASLLNGSPYNFIFVGDELSLERVILTRRDPNIF